MAFAIDQTYFRYPDTLVDTRFGRSGLRWSF
jgi:hypothetical protein